MFSSTKSLFFAVLLAHTLVSAQLTTPELPPATIDGLLPTTTDDLAATTDLLGTASQTLAVSNTLASIDTASGLATDSLSLSATASVVSVTGSLTTTPSVATSGTITPAASTQASTISSFSVYTPSSAANVTAQATASATPAGAAGQDNRLKRAGIIAGAVAAALTVFACFAGFYMRKMQKHAHKLMFSDVEHFTRPTSQHESVPLTSAVGGQVNTPANNPYSDHPAPWEANAAAAAPYDRHASAASSVASLAAPGFGGPGAPLPNPYGARRATPPGTGNPYADPFQPSIYRRDSDYSYRGTAR